MTWYGTRNMFTHIIFPSSKHAKNYYKIYSMHCIMVFTYEQRKFGQTKFHLLPRIQHWAVFNLKKDTWALVHSNLMLGSTRSSALFNYHTIPSTNFYQDTGTQIKMSIYISHINTLSSLYIHINQYVPQHFLTSVCLDIALQLELYCLSWSSQFYQLTILIKVFSMGKVASKSEHGNEKSYIWRHSYIKIICRLWGFIPFQLNQY